MHWIQETIIWKCYLFLSFNTTIISHYWKSLQEVVVVIMLQFLKIVLWLIFDLRDFRASNICTSTVMIFQTVTALFKSHLLISIDNLLCKLRCIDFGFVFVFTLYNFIYKYFKRICFKMLFFFKLLSNSLL